MTQSPTLRSSILDEDDSDDDDLDAELSFTPFSQEESSNKPTTQQSQPSPETIITPPKEEDSVETQGTHYRYTILHCIQHSSSNTLFSTIAQRKLKTVSRSVDDNITNTDQLYWHVYRYKKGKKAPLPVRLCRDEEGVGIFPEGWDREKKVLVQYIGHSSDNNEIGTALKKEMKPYYGSNLQKDRWCPELWKEFETYMTNHVTMDRVSVRLEELVLDRTLQLAKEKERRVEEEEEAVSDDDDDDGPVVVDVDTRTTTANKTDTFLSEHGAPDHDEPLRDGDVIEYTQTIFVAGDERGRRTTKILSVNRARNPMLILENGEILPQDTRVRRVQRKVRTKMIPYNGKMRAISEHKLKTSAVNVTIADGLKREAKRVGEIVDSNMDKLAANLKESGCGPVDLLHNFSKRRGVTVEEKADADVNGEDDCMQDAEGTADGNVESVAAAKEEDGADVEVQDVADVSNESNAKTDATEMREGCVNKSAAVNDANDPDGCNGADVSGESNAEIEATEIKEANVSKDATVNDTNETDGCNSADASEESNAKTGATESREANVSKDATVNDTNDAHGCNGADVSNESNAKTDATEMREANVYKIVNDANDPDGCNSADVSNESIAKTDATEMRETNVSKDAIMKSAGASDDAAATADTSRGNSAGASDNTTVDSGEAFSRRYGHLIYYLSHFNFDASDCFGRSSDSEYTYPQRKLGAAVWVYLVKIAEVVCAGDEALATETVAKIIAHVSTTMKVSYEMLAAFLAGKDLPTEEAYGNMERMLRMWVKNEIACATQANENARTAAPENEASAPAASLPVASPNKSQSGKRKFIAEPDQSKLPAAKKAARAPEVVAIDDEPQKKKPHIAQPDQTASSEKPAASATKSQSGKRKLIAQPVKLPAAKKAARTPEVVVIDDEPPKKKLRGSKTGPTGELTQELKKWLTTQQDNKCRRRGPIPHLTESQLRLAIDVRRKLDGKSVDEAAELLERQVDSNKWRLGHFLSGDLHRVLRKDIHEETEVVLAEWLAKEKGKEASAQNEV